MWLTRPFVVQLLLFSLPSPVCMYWHDPSSRKLSPRENDLSDFSHSPSSCRGTVWRDSLAEPQWRGAAVHPTGLNPASYFFPSRLFKGCAPCQGYFLPLLVSWPGLLLLRSKLKCHVLPEIFPPPILVMHSCYVLITSSTLLQSHSPFYFITSSFLISVHTCPNWTGSSTWGVNSPWHPQSRAEQCRAVQSSALHSVNTSWVDGGMSHTRLRALLEGLPNKDRQRWRGGPPSTEGKNSHIGYFYARKEFLSWL